MPLTERVAIATTNGAGTIQSTKNEPFSIKKGGQNPGVPLEGRTYPLSAVRKSNRFNRLHAKKRTSKHCA